MRKLFTLIALCLSLAVMALQPYSTATLPNPKTLCAECWVANPDGIVGEKTVSDINYVAASVKQASNVEIALVAVNAFDESEYADAFEFCQALFNYWGIGSKDNNAGVLVFFALHSRDIRIHTGGGLEGLLPDGVCQEIIDNNISTLSRGEYDKGLLSIVVDIAQRVTTDNAKAELLLGYKPKQIDGIETTTTYLILTILVFLLLYIIAYLRWNSKEKTSRQALMTSTATLQTVMGFLAFIFPLSMLPLYIVFRRKRKTIRTAPLTCQRCGHQMRLLSGHDKTSYLTPQQQTEEKIGSRQYDVWTCPECGNIDIEKYKGNNTSYTMCPNCQTVGCHLVQDQTILPATYRSTGKRRLTYRCAYCGKETYNILTIPMLTRVVTSSGGGGFSSGGGSFGGSFGGGSSFGGGAGGKF